MLKGYYIFFQRIRTSKSETKKKILKLENRFLNDVLFLLEASRMIKNLGERRLSWRRSVQKEEKPPPKVIYSGYLTKQGSIVKNWKKRWFVLTDDSELSYWIDER